MYRKHILVQVRASPGICTARIPPGVADNSSLRRYVL